MDALVVGIILISLVPAVGLLFFGKRLGKLSGWIAVTALAACFGAALLMFTELLNLPGQLTATLEGVSEESGALHANGRVVIVHLFDWISVGSFNVGADFLVDQLAVVMTLVITGVGSLIALYSVGYMKDDERFHRYFAYLLLFVAAMLTLVLADNLLLMYVGWEGVGLCSYLLIGFWFERPAAANAAKKAFLINRIGDFSFLLGILLLAGTVGSLTVNAVNGAAAFGDLEAGVATIAALLLFGGATGKSAQLPLYVWLPDAMEGPTPASALIHAATMVTAGVYMVARFAPVFSASAGDVALTVVAWTGALTALWAALMASAQYDIKRVLAYSTVSQLGYMFLANGLEAYSAGIFHLVTHAFFKALMFLGAGSVMHALAGNVDMRKMGGLRKVMPITGLTFAAGWLAISGIVPFSGFFSKDAILAVAWEQGEYALWGIGVLTALFTAFYMSRLYFRVFEGKLVHPPGTHPHESPPTMAVPLMILAVLSVVGGILNLPGTLTLEHFLEPALGHFAVPEGITSWILGGIALSVGIVGILVARFFYLSDRGADMRGRLRKGSWLDRFIGSARDRFYVDEIYGDLIVMPGKRLATFSAYSLDAKGVDGIVRGSGKLVGGLSEYLRRVQTGYVRNYAAAFLFGAVLLLAVVAIRVGG